MALSLSSCTTRKFDRKLTRRDRIELWEPKEKNGYVTAEVDAPWANSSTHAAAISNESVFPNRAATAPHWVRVSGVVSWPSAAAMGVLVRCFPFSQFPTPNRFTRAALSNWSKANGRMS